MKLMTVRTAPPVAITSPRMNVATRIEYTLLSHHRSANTGKRADYSQNDERNGTNNHPCDSKPSLDVIVFGFGDGDDAKKYAGDAQPPKCEQRNAGKYKRQDCSYHNLVPSFLNLLFTDSTLK